MPPQTLLDPAQLAEEAPSRMQKQLPLPHPGTRFSNCSLSTQSLQCFPQRAAGQLSPASLQPQHLLISSGAYLTPGVSQFLSKPSQLLASPPNLGACATHLTLPSAGHTSRVYLYFLCPEQRVLEGTPATCSTVERLRRETLHFSLLRFPQ